MTLREVNAYLRISGGAANQTVGRRSNRTHWRRDRHINFLDQPGATDDFNTAQDSQINAAIADADAITGGATVWLPKAGFTTQITIPGTVNIDGSGGGVSGTDGPTLLKALHANGQLYWSGGSNGFVRQLRVTGNDLAPTPVRIGPVAQYEFTGLAVDNAAAGGAAVKLEGTQNSFFALLTIVNCAGDGLRIDSDVTTTLDTNSNIFEKFEIRGNEGFQITFTTQNTGAATFPNNNTFIGGIIEDLAGAGVGALNAIYHGAGIANAFRNCILINRSVPGASAVVKMRKDGVPPSLDLFFDSCQFAGITGALGTTAFDLGASTRVVLTGQNRFNALDQLWFVAAAAGQSRIYGEVNLATVTTYFASPDGGTENALLWTVMNARHRITRFSTSDDALEILVSGETQPRLRLRAGNIFWGDGTAALDAGLERDSANVIRTFAGDSFKSSSHLEIDGDLNHDGTLVGFYGVTPVARPIAYTQTFATADKTHAADGSADLATTAATNVTPWGFAGQAQAEDIATQVNLLRATVADLKQLVNSVIDDLQALGLVQ